MDFLLKKLKLLNSPSTLTLTLSLEMCNESENNVATDVYYVNDYDKFTQAPLSEGTLPTLYQNYF